jgi:hypothetical protein
VSDGENEQAAREAVTLAYAFWRALASDDDSALPPICFGGFLGHLGGPGPGIAKALRERMGLERDQCAVMGVTNHVRLLDDSGLITVGLQPRGPGLQIFGLDGPELMHVWPLLVYQTAEDMVRRIFGGADLEEMRPRIVGHVELEFDIPAEGPVQ